MNLTHNSLIFILVFLGTGCSSLPQPGDGVTEFCLEGELDLGTRYQGTRPMSGEFYATSWCVITESGSDRVMFSGAGKSNPDMDGNWTVAYLPPDMVRIVNRDAPPDVEFQGTNTRDEAMRVRRMDPRRLVEDLRATRNGIEGIVAATRGDRVISVNTNAELPLRGRVTVDWNWDWTDPSQPTLELILDDELLFNATGRWRALSDDEVSKLWLPTPGVEPTQVPGQQWPSQVNMRLLTLTEGVHVVRGVRTGFQHLVVETDEGLVVGDAPAGWVEFHHIPPTDLVPGLGVSGLSERLIDFLRAEFPEEPVRAVALTHFHDDHAGGARAFAAAGANIYTTAESAIFFSKALNRDSMPEDRLSDNGGPAKISPVVEPLLIGGDTNRVKLMPMGPGPHAYAMLGVWAVDKDYFFVSDVHVPRSDADTPRKGREKTECWFAEWAVRNLPAEVRVVNSHSPNVTPVSRLARYVASDACRSL